MAVQELISCLVSLQAHVNEVVSTTGQISSSLHREMSPRISSGGRDLHVAPQRRSDPKGARLTGRPSIGFGTIEARRLPGI